MDGVTCIGGTVADLLARPVGAMPDPGRLTLVDEMRLAPGGCAVNSASALARLGVPARLIGRKETGGLIEILLLTRRHTVDLMRTSSSFCRRPV